MWTREELKTRAKAVLSKNYWQAFAVALVVCLIGTEGGGGGSSARGAQQNTHYYGDVDAHFLVGTFLIATIIGLVILCIRLFVGYMIEVGGRRFFIKAAQGESNMSYLGSSFNRNDYWDVFKSMLYRDVLTFLWTLLLIIPGIIKGYAYRMVPYILADNPNIGYKRAVELSNAMTMNQKFDIFVLDLSFIGWYLLGTIALGVGVLFVKPYDYSTNGELYLKLREQALEKGICSYEELNLQAE
nr:DUF975 family protein [uncultured Cellulosilyticum sp.]